MEWLATILTSQNAFLILVTLVVLILLLAFLAKKGLVSFDAKGLKVGMSECERSIVRRQLEFVDIVLDSTFRDIPKNLQNDHGLVVISKVKDEFEKMIVFNHITDDDDYLELKQEVVLATVLKNTIDPYFKTPEFADYMNALTKKIIKRLVKIRQGVSK